MELVCYIPLREPATHFESFGVLTGSHDSRCLQSKPSGSC
jgi:hypothetical protein